MDITSKVNGDTLSAAEFNEITTELETNLINKSGQTASSGDLAQVGVAVASIAAQSGVFAVDSGTANTYVLSQVSPFPAPYSFKNGLTIRFRAGNANTGASTVNPFGLGVKNIKQADGTTDLASGMITTGADIVIRYNSALDVFILGGTASQYNIGTTSGTIPLIGTQSATTSLAGLCSLATSAEVLTGSNNTKAITPLALAQNFTNSKITNGYTYLPNGIIMQWGTATSFSSDEVKTVNFPIPFPTGVLNLSATVKKSGDVAGVVNFYTFPVSNSQFTITSDGATTSNTFDAYWMAIGY